jgi:hypothetical protein
LSRTPGAKNQPITIHHIDSRKGLSGIRAKRIGPVDRFGFPSWIDRKNTFDRDTAIGTRHYEGMAG